MHGRVRTIAQLRRLMPVLLMACVFGANAQEQDSVTADVAMFRIMEGMYTPVVAYCAENVPELREEMTLASDIFLKKMAEASQFIMQDLPEGGRTNVPAAAIKGMPEMVQDFGEKLVDMARLYDTELFCVRLIVQLQGVSVEDLKKTMAAAYADYLDRIRAKEKAASE